MLVSGTACWKGLAMKEKAQEIWRPHLVEANTWYEVGTGPSPNLGSCLLPACHADTSGSSKSPGWYFPSFCQMLLCFYHTFF